VKKPDQKQGRSRPEKGKVVGATSAEGVCDRKLGWEKETGAEKKFAGVSPHDGWGQGEIGGPRQGGGQTRTASI